MTGRPPGSGLMPLPTLTAAQTARFHNAIVSKDDCWLWRPTICDAYGYAKFSLGSVKYMAHRLSYELHVGPIPEGMFIDHLCRVRRCVNPAHLEAVTQRVNLLRGNTLAAACAVKTHCPRGHAYDLFNTIYDRGPYGELRRCRTCRRAERQRRYAARKEAVPA